MSRFAPPSALPALLALLLSACVSDGPQEADPEQELSMHREFALRYYDQGDLARAEQQVDKGLEIEAQDPQLLLMKGWIRQRRGTAQDIFVAERIFRDLEPGDDYRAELGLAEALERKGLLFSEASEGVASGERATESPDPAARAEELQAQARECWAESELLYERVLGRKPGEFQALNGLQRVLALQGRYEESLAWSRTLLEQSELEMEFWRVQLRRPDLTAEEEGRLRALLEGSTRLQVETRLSAATLLVAVGRQQQALEQLDRTLALAPERAEILSRRAQLLQALGRYREAAASIQEFLRMSELPFEHPDVRRAYTLLSECESASRSEAAPN